LAGLDRHSVHSRVITSRTPLFFAMEGRAPLCEQGDNHKPYSFGSQGRFLRMAWFVSGQSCGSRSSG
jgi:hypothetical protein